MAFCMSWYMNNFCLKISFFPNLLIFKFYIYPWYSIKIINITNNRGTLFYDKDRALSNCINMVAENIINENKFCPTLSNSNEEIIQFLQKNGKGGLLGNIKRIASSLG